MDKAIINSTLITMTGKGLGIIDNGAVGIEGSTIRYVGKSDDLDLSGVDVVIDGENQVVIPGLINAHFHSSSSLLKGCAQDVPEIEWMNKAMAPLGKYLTDEDRILGSKLAVLEGLRTGTTTFAEYTGNVEPLVTEVYHPWGVRVVAAETINEISADKSRMGPTDLYPLDTSKGKEGLKRHDSLENLGESAELIDVMYGPQAVDMVSKETLHIIDELAKEEEKGIHMHVAQGRREAIQIEKRYGNSTIGFLNSEGLLSSNLLAAHIHGTNHEEREVMIENGVKMVSCQSSIGFIDGIVPPLADYTNLGGVAGIGTDQIPGVGHTNLFREMRTGALLGKVLMKDPTVLPPWKMLELATIGGARVLGIDDKVGSIKVGKQADLIMLDLTSPTLLPQIHTPFRNIIPNIVYSATGHEVSMSMIAGNILVDNKQLKVGMGITAEEINKIANNLTQQAREDWRSVGSKMVEYSDAGFL